MFKELTPYEKAGRLLRLFAWIQFILGTMIIAAVAIPHIVDPILRQALVGGILGFALNLAILWGLSVFQFILGKAVKDHKEWGRTVGIIYSVILLLGFPVGTLVGVYVLWCLIRGWDATSI